MKKTLFLALFIAIGLTIFACSKEQTSEQESAEKYEPLSYDTTAIDSFSQGAISVNVAEQIRKSSLSYQDSVKKVKIQQEQDRKAKEEADKKAAEEKKKQEELNKNKPAETPAESA